MESRSQAYSAAPDRLEEADFRRVSELVYRHCRINLHDGKRELVRARVAKQAREHGFATTGAYLGRVLADPAAEPFADLVDALSTNLTHFFRERNHFDYLREQALPSLCARKRAARSTRVRAWSAGCSTGEEPYSLAMTLLEDLDRESRWDVKILATDISRRVLRTARAGRYEADRLGDVPRLFRDRYFAPARRSPPAPPALASSPAMAPSVAREPPWWEAGPELRGVVQFRYLNLMGAWPFRGPFDLIFCRNVMIYFDKPTQEALVARFFECLGPGGLLFTGHSESLTGVSHRFRYVQPTIYVKP